MERTISPKIKKQLDIILELKTQINTWKSYNEQEVFQIVKEFEKKPRDEGSFWFEEILSNKELASDLVNIGNKYSENTKMNVYIVSALGNMIKRYKLESSEEIFNYFLEKAQTKGVELYVSFFLPYLPQFEKYERKWEYIMSIKNIKPLKDSEISFKERIDYFLNQLPIKYVEETITFFEQSINEAKSDYSKNMYRELIEKLQMK
ncbi:hypothetical protein [Flavobacterium aquidurense]|uniref:Uncharacterized protein n=1 Tax=Flavobacterium aquidurense TaxID=362413 RepID=A0A0N8VLT7_9FLAO|nr:hypothetical protein [Flavobacterium aquidurense]KQB37436.1 hypothetical protein RC62_2602 [Flavobacterium aquidurense]